MNNFNLNEEEMEKLADKIVEEMIREKSERINYVKLNSTKIMDKLYKCLKNKKTIDDEDILYFPEEYDFNSSDFNHMFSLMEEYFEETIDSVTDENNYFPNYSYYFKYKDSIIELFTMIGQGTARIMKILDENEVNELIKNNLSDCIGDFDEFVKYIESL